MASLRISELAEATGFPAATLRYYESVGLLTPERDPNGYRRYTDSDADRLRFVARAKQLGLKLDEIAELVDLRGDGDCPPVRARLAGLVHDKLHDTYRSITDLTVFAAELARLAEQMQITEAPAVCGDGCGCPDQPLALAPTAAPPVSCTLDADQRHDRQADWQALTAAAQTSEPASHGWRLQFPADPSLAARVASLAASEQRCCPFFTFTLGLGGDSLTLDVHAPPETWSLLVDLFGPQGAAHARPAAGRLS